MLDCDICGEAVYVSRIRYVQLVKAGRRPRCRKNGCERLCGPHIQAAARMTETLDTIEVPLRRVHWPRAKKGNRNGALARLRVSQDQRWRWEAAGAADERNET